MPLMDYLKYVMIVGLASLSMAAVNCVVLWLMAPYIMGRAGPAGSEPGDNGPEPAPPAGPAPRGVFFDFTAEQAPALAGLLKNESPEDIAVVVSRLPAGAGRALLAAHSPELRAKVLASLASPRTVDQELMRGMKAELENRLYGVVGGAAEAAPFIKALSYKERKAVLENVSSQNPARGAELRVRFVLDEDLAALPDKDLRALAAAVPVDTLGAWLPALPEKLKARLREQFTGKAALALQRAELGAPQGADRTEAALDGVIGLVEDLVAKGTIDRPKPQASAKAAAASAPEAKPKRVWG